MSDRELWTMKEMGLRLGLTSHQVGKMLKDLGLRTADGRPTPVAFGKGLVGQRWTADGRHYLWTWDVDRVLPLLGGADPVPSSRAATGGKPALSGEQSRSQPKP